MGRKVFISFLGTSNYVECNYHDEKKTTDKVSRVKFIQEAIFKLYCRDFKENDAVYIFTTELAEKTNYHDNGQWNNVTKQYDLPNKGLYQALLDLKLPNLPSVENIRIPEGFSENEIWEIFEIISDKINNEDEIILDITHAFRFLPMLGLTLIDYLKVVKNVKVNGIYYGAFEKLGVAVKVKSLPLEERNAPIINLISLVELQHWTQAASNFKQFGFIENIRSLTNKTILPILANTKGKDEGSKNLRNLGNFLNSLIANIYTNRGKELMNIEKGKFEKLILQIESSVFEIKPLREVFKIIKDKVNPIVKSQNVWLESAKWCHKHHLTQQGITQLQEGILTYLLDYLKSKYQEPYFDSLGEKPRTFMASFLNVSNNKLEIAHWRGELLEKKELAHKIKDDEFLTQFTGIFAELTGIRNDIQHAGYLQNSAKSTVFENNLETYINTIEKIITHAP